jgi:amicoumacin kinase
MERAVVDLLIPDHLRQALDAWNITETPDPIGEEENFVYRVGEHRILRLTHSSHRTANLVRGDMDWIRHLSDHGVSVCRPVLSRRGDLVEVIPTGDTYFVAALFPRARGALADRSDPAVWNEHLFRRWGQVTGRMHAATRSYQPSDPAIRLQTWEEEDLFVNADRYLRPDDHLGRATLQDRLAWLQSLPRDPGSFGLIHTDIHQWNFFVHESEITVFDFDDCTYSWFVEDLAMPLYYTLLGIPRENQEEREAFTRRFFHSCMEGYRKEYHLDDFWLSQIPGFLRPRDLVLYIFCYKKFDISNLSPAEALWCEMMRQALHSGAPPIELDFASLSK